MSTPYSLSFQCPHCSMDHTAIPCSLEPSIRLLVCSLVCRVNGAACAFRPGTLHQTVRIPIARLFSFFKPSKSNRLNVANYAKEKDKPVLSAKGPLLVKDRKGPPLPFPRRREPDIATPSPITPAVLPAHTPSYAHSQSPLHSSPHQ